MKKKLLAWLTLTCLTVSLCGCDIAAMIGGGKQSATSSTANSVGDSSLKEDSSLSEDSSAMEDSSFNSSIQDVVDDESFTTLFDAPYVKRIASNESHSHFIDRDIGDQNYIKIEYESDVNLYGEFVYKDLADSSKVVHEPFFLEAGETEFKQFLDAYRPNGVGLFDKYLSHINLTNVDGQDGDYNLKTVSISGRDIPEMECEVYLEKNGLKIGADLALGGSLTYVSRVDYNGQTVDEIIDKDGNVKYGVDAKSEPGAQLISSEVNLVAIFDPGRQIQQSYYAEVGGTDEEKTGANGYDRGWCYTDSSEGDWWSYNPVQAGDCADNPAQLIDYEITNNQIYVKARPMDWGKGWQENWASKYEQKAKELGSMDALGIVKGGVTTKSYMENWYTIKGGMLYVDNEFIDWNGFADMDNIRARNCEIPAFFPVHTLHTFVTYNGLGPWGGDTVGLFRHKNPSSHSEEGQQQVGSEDWFAWVNDDDFGMGLYVPNVDRYTYSKITASASIDAPYNAGAYTCPMVTTPALMKNKPMPTSDYTACYARNTCYTAPIVLMRMREYETMRYQYVLAIDQLTSMREKFYDLHDASIISNETLDAWR